MNLKINIITRKEFTNLDIFLSDIINFINQKNSFNGSS